MTGRRRWGVLAVGTSAQAATCSFLYGVPMLVPALRAQGLSLFHATVLSSAPMVGLLLTLVAWGALADRHGERVVIASGVGLAAGFLVLAAGASDLVWRGLWLALAGACGASVNAASGRLVMGWFPPALRGLAMGTRQTAQPLGVAVAALGLPGLGARVGPGAALLFPAGLCAAAALAVLIVARDPVRSTGEQGLAPVGGSPYRGSSTLARVHLASTMLVVPQFAVATFTLAYLVAARGWDAAVAGRWVFAFQAAGALGRIVAGVWSDRARSRLGPMRRLGVASAALMVLLALGALVHGAWIVAVFALAAVVTVADNGLAYTSVAELAGTAWSGRALGLHNTVQNVAAILAGPLLAAVIGDARWSLAFLVTAVFPVLAVPLTPVAAERRTREPAAAH